MFMLYYHSRKTNVLGVQHKDLNYICFDFDTCIEKVKDIFPAVEKKDFVSIPNRNKCWFVKNVKHKYNHTASRYTVVIYEFSDSRLII